MAEAVRAFCVTQFTYYLWRKNFGGLKSAQVKRLKELEKEDERLRKAVSDLTLEKLIRRKAATGNTPTGEACQTGHASGIFAKGYKISGSRGVTWLSALKRGRGADLHQGALSQSGRQSCQFSGCEESGCRPPVFGVLAAEPSCLSLGRRWRWR